MEWNKTLKDYFTIPAFKSPTQIDCLEEKQVSIKDWMRFLGIFIAEGTICHNVKSYSYRIQLAAVKSREKNFINKLLQKMDVKFSEYSDRFMIMIGEFLIN